MKTVFTIIYSIPQLPNEKFEKVFFTSKKDDAVQAFKALPETQDANILSIIPAMRKNVELSVKI